MALFFSKKNGRPNEKSSSNEMIINVETVDQKVAFRFITDSTILI